MYILFNFVTYSYLGLMIHLRKFHYLIVYSVNNTVIILGSISIPYQTSGTVVTSKLNLVSV